MWLRPEEIYTYYKEDLDKIVSEKKNLVNEINFNRNSRLLILYKDFPISLVKGTTDYNSDSHMAVLYKCK